MGDGVNHVTTTWLWPILDDNCFLAIQGIYFLPKSFVLMHGGDSQAYGADPCEHFRCQTEGAMMASTTSPTATLCHWVCSTSYADLPAEVRQETVTLL
jgi:hypothetical protein